MTRVCNREEYDEKTPLGDGANSAEEAVADSILNNQCSFHIPLY